MVLTIEVDGKTYPFDYGLLVPCIGERIRYDDVGYLRVVDVTYHYKHDMDYRKARIGIIIKCEHTYKEDAFYSNPTKQPITLLRR